MTERETPGSRAGFRAARGARGSAILRGFVSLFPGVMIAKRIEQFAMAVGKATRELSFEGDKEHVFEEIRSALATIGRVTEVDEPTFVRGRTRVGLQRVDVRVSIQERGAFSVAQIEAFADDV
ncbi:MAG: hypothetical protein HY240_06230 [Actinobacteria bacterium]|nr:hypothetical protein [Actinomycetota bacterium]